MRRITSCLVCSSEDLASSPAIVAPFIREYALGGAGRPEVPTQAAHSTGLSVLGVLATRAVPATEPPAGQASP